MTGYMLLENLNHCLIFRNNFNNIRKTLWCTLTLLMVQWVDMKAEKNTH